MCSGGECFHVFVNVDGVLVESLWLSVCCLDDDDGLLNELLTRCDV